MTAVSIGTSMMGGKASHQENEDEDNKLIDITDDVVNYSLVERQTLIGVHEIQISECGEDDLQKYFSRCLKNPGHKLSIPVGQFTLEHLPKSHRNDLMHDFIKAAAGLTVRISLDWISPHRPEFWPQTTVPYPFYDSRGLTYVRYGSGMVCGVASREDLEKCPCKECKRFIANKPNLWIIYVQTASQLVYDTFESSNASVTFFYDNEHSPVKTCKDISKSYNDIKNDFCNLACVIYDDQLGVQLSNMFKQYDNLQTEVRNTYKILRDRYKLMFIVSHPHGRSKRISIGEWKNFLLGGESLEQLKFTYITCTCPGSTGASIHCVGFHSSRSNLVHSGALQSGLTYSSLGYVYNQN